MLCSRHITRYFHNIIFLKNSKRNSGVRTIFDMFRLVAEHLPPPIRDSRIEITSRPAIVLSIFVVIRSAIPLCNMCNFLSV